MLMFRGEQTTCKECHGVFHKVCFKPTACPKCARIAKRKLKQAAAAAVSPTRASFS